MKRIFVLVSVLATVAILATPAPVAAQSVGGGISVFVPWEMLSGNTGSISFETALETSVGLGNYLSFPVGFAYNQIYGLAPEGALEEGGAEISHGGPWFYADSILPYLMAKVHIPIAMLYVDVFGGVAANYNFSLRPFHDRIARDLRSAGFIGEGAAAGDPVGVTDLKIDSGFGFGFVAGAGAGVTIGDIQVGLKATYRHIWHSLEVSGRAFSPGGTEEFEIPEDNLQVVLRGISFGIGGNFSF